MTKRNLALAVALAALGAAWTAPAAAQESAADAEMDQANLGETVVTAARQDRKGTFVTRRGAVGFLGSKDTMDVPFTTTNITQKAITQFDDGANPLPNALLMSPSVRTSTSTMYNDYSIRGFQMNAYQFKVNGVPGMFSQTNMPANFVESIEVVSGPAIGIHGTTNSESAGGSVNLTTKKAEYGKERITYRQTINGRGALGEAFDIGKRFGKNEQWGVRVSAENIQGKTAVEREKLTTRDFYVNLDHVGNRSTTNLFAGYRYTKNEGGQRYFAFDGAGAYAYTGDRLPDPPNGKRNYSFPGQQITVSTWSAVLNHEQKINKDWKAFLNAGHSYNLGSGYVQTSASRLYMLDEAGHFGNKLSAEKFALRNSYVQLGVQGTFHIGQVKNDVVFAADRNWYRAYWGFRANGIINGATGFVSFGSVAGNLSDGVTSVTQNYPYAAVTGPIKTGQTRYSGISLTDTLEYGKASLLLGIHHHSVDVTGYDKATGAATSTVHSSANSPTYGIVYKPTENLSLYANHSQSFDKGSVVGSNRMNTGAMLAPAKTKQNELGVKYRKNGLSAGLSLFQIEQDRSMDVTYAGDPHPTAVMEGKNTLKGVELSVSGRIAPKWTLTGGLMHLSTEQQTNTAYNGKAVSGIADWSAMLAAEYTADAKTAAFLRMVYSGKAPIYANASKQLEVPAYVTVDLGVTYKTTLGTVPTMFGLTAYNILDKQYWMSRPTYNYAIQGLPRSFMLSMQMDI
ncbi:TonB-dependent receptor domain-containing protein [uncultured Selenomonas sp.]|uniref:TonB-dependent receptor n=1 Tax=uncultured Selenomonas sp. TaxID=159275 RepID=UPI0028E2C78E|nr:TonB-dependent receptor [uncultured Selenomonas sp.]